MASVWTVCTALSLMAGIYYLKRSGLLMKMLFPIGYMLYAHTSLGYYYHQKQLQKKPASHSKVDPVRLVNKTGADVIIYLLPFLKDNYCYLVTEQTTRVGVAIDPADPEVLKQALRQYDVTLSAILTTHKHWDHAGGNRDLKEVFPHISIYGGRRDNPSASNQLLDGGEEIKIGDLTFLVTSTPGHTIGHMIYTLTSTTPPCLFTGDHLFLAGCGRLFEDTAERMYHSLRLVKRMDPSTLIFPGHEYTWSNLKFAAYVDPNNVNVQEKLEAVRKLRMKRLTTVPAVLSEELEYNPFLRTDSSSIMDKVGVVSGRSQAEVFALLRKEKDNFKID